MDKIKKRRIGVLNLLQRSSICVGYNCKHCYRTPAEFYLLQWLFQTVFLIAHLRRAAPAIRFCFYTNPISTE